MPDALDQVRIVDFSRVLAGPFATMVLGDLGAEVLKVERPGVGDDTRAWGPPYDEAGDATYFLSVNRNKLGIALDLSRPDDLGYARQLALDADVLVENFRPGVMDRLGLGYDALQADNPGLVYCSITGFGKSKGAKLPGYDLLVQAMGGLMSVTGEVAGKPQKVGVALVDVLAGLFAASGILAALRHRERNPGEGQRVEIDLLSSLLAALVNQASAYTCTGVVPGRLGNRHPSIAPYEVFDAGDGSLVVAVGNDRQFRALCRCLGVPEIADDSRFTTNDERVRHRDELCELLEQELRRRSARVWAEELMRAGVPAGVINDVAGAFDLARHLGLDPVATIHRPDGTAVRLPRSPIAMSRTPVTYRHAPPRLPAWMPRDGE